MKLGKKRRKGSKRNYCIISPRVKIKAIVIINDARQYIRRHRGNGGGGGPCPPPPSLRRLS